MRSRGSAAIPQPRRLSAELFERFRSRRLKQRAAARPGRRRCSARRQTRLRGCHPHRTTAPSAWFVSSRWVHPNMRGNPQRNAASARVCGMAWGLAVNHATIRRASRRLLRKHPRSSSKPYTYCRCHPCALRVHPVSGQGARRYRRPADDRACVSPGGSRTNDRRCHRRHRR